MKIYDTFHYINKFFIHIMKMGKASNFHGFRIDSKNSSRRLNIVILIKDEL